MDFPGEIITVGSKNSVAIKAIKERLNELGYATLRTDNPIFGPSTLTAVQSFQDKNQLKPDGVVGELTWERLFTASIIQPITSKNLVDRVFEWLDTQLYVRELTGHNDGREIEEYQKITGIPKGSSYCQALLYTGFYKQSAELGIKNPMPQTGGVLNHRDLIRTGKYKAVVLPVSKAQPKDLFIMDFHRNYEGHTGGIEEIRNGMFWTVEGNTNTDGSRNGNGNYERSRDPKTIDCVIRYI